MDPISCLSLASNVSQFIEFSFKIYSGTRQLYENGRLDVHEQTFKAVKELGNFSKEMRLSIQTIPEHSDYKDSERELQILCIECSKLADEMVAHLEKFRITQKRNVLKSVRQVLRSMWSSKELAEAERKLARYRDMINSRLLGSLRERVDQALKEQCTQTTVINEHTRQIVARALLDIHTSINRDLQTHTKVISALVDREVRNFHDMDELHKGILESFRKLSSSYADIGEEEKIYFNVQQREAILHRAMTQEIVDSLRYETIDERYETISEAHRKTFEWILAPMEGDDSSHQPHWSDFVHWLREGDGIYWINGKAGSGKSTLMKYIYDNPRTREHLQAWSKETPLYVAPFFFWWRGTTIQKSQVGLLRSLLYDVLRQMPELVPAVFPSQWASLYTAKTNLSKLPSVHIWTTSSLSRAFQALLIQQQIPIRLCLFIDGLDEYEGLEVEIAKVFKGVVLSRGVKVCVSSRPHVPFEDAFSGYPMLRLQDLTDSDIHRYIQDRLVHDEMMEVLMSKEPKECRSLVNEIADSAQGVFLWVMLVVSSLINGLSNHDRISDLQARLRILPKDLDKLYEEMVLKVDGIYAEEASRLYQLVSEAIFQQEDWKPPKLLSLRTLSLAMKPDLDMASEMKIIMESPLDERTMFEQAKTMDILLKTRCGGLLEVQYGKYKTSDLSPSMGVSYLHRTVRDFLEACETRAILLQRTGGPEKSAFKPAVAIFQSIAVQVKQLSESESQGNISQSHVMKDQGLTYARRIDLDKRLSPKELFYLLDGFAQAARWHTMVPAAITTSLCRYLQLKLEDEKSIEPTALSRPALDALVPSSETGFITSHMVTLLIKFGANPNKRYNGSTPWKNFLSYILGYIKKKPPMHVLIAWSEIIHVLLENGADPRAECGGPDRYEDRRKRGSSFAGNWWSVSNIIEGLFGTPTGFPTHLKVALTKALQDAKSKPRAKQPVEALGPIHKTALILNNISENSNLHDQTIHTPRARIFKIGLCCSQ